MGKPQQSPNSAIKIISSESRDLRSTTQNRLSLLQYYHHLSLPILTLYSVILAHLSVPPKTHVSSFLHFCKYSIHKENELINTYVTSTKKYLDPIHGARGSLQHQAILYTSTGCPILQLNFDTFYP